jgi:hypothetical protein
MNRVMMKQISRLHLWTLVLYKGFKTIINHVYLKLEDLVHLDKVYKDTLFSVSSINTAIGLHVGLSIQLLMVSLPLFLKIAFPTKG